MRKFVLAIIGLVGILTSAHGQIQYFSKQQLNEDLDSLLISIEEIHPDMYANISKEDFQLKVNNAKNQLHDSLSRMDFFILISPLLTCLGDGHTSLAFPREDFDGIKANLFPFPVNVDWKDSSVFINADRADPKTGIPVGAKIFTINNKPVKQILSEMYNLISGERVFFKNSNVEWDFTRYLYLLYHDSSFLVQFEFENNVLEKTVSGIPVSQRYPTFPQVTDTLTSVKNYPINIRILPDSSIAIITIYYFPRTEPWEPSLDSIFRVIKENKIKDLIIDIRNNGGGNSLRGDEFFQYISKVPYKQFGESIVKISPKQIAYYKKTYKQNVTKPIGITFESDPLVSLQKTKYKFKKGKIYLLISNDTYSSAASFSWAFQYFKMGTVIGEETGGMAVCFGNIVEQTLPNTKLKYQVSHCKFYQYGATDNDTHGTLPDYEVSSPKASEYTINLIMNGRK